MWAGIEVGRGHGVRLQAEPPRKLVQTRAPEALVPEAEVDRLQARRQHAHHAVPERLDIREREVCECDLVTRLP